MEGDNIHVTGLYTDHYSDTVSFPLYLLLFSLKIWYENTKSFIFTELNEFYFPVVLRQQMALSVILFLIEVWANEYNRK